jgi:DNA end-binding protein Ku
MLEGDFEPEKYRDNYREALLELIEAKAEGQEIKRPAPAASKITDLMEALRASVDAAKKDKAGGKAAAAEEEAEEEPAEKPARRRRAS